MSDNFVKSNTDSDNPKKKGYKINWSEVDNTSNDFLGTDKNASNVIKKNILGNKIKDKNYLNKSRKAVINEINKEKGRNNVNKNSFWGFLGSNNDIKVKNKINTPEPSKKEDEKIIKKELPQKEKIINEKPVVKAEIPKKVNINSNTPDNDEVSFFELLLGRRKKKKILSNNLLNDNDIHEQVIKNSEKKGLAKESFFHHKSRKSSIQSVKIPQETSELPDIILNKSKEKVIIAPPVKEKVPILAPPRKADKDLDLAPSKKVDIDQVKTSSKEVLSLPPKKEIPSNIGLPKKSFNKDLDKNKIKSKHFFRSKKDQSIIKTNLVEKQKKEYNHQSRLIMILGFIVFGLIVVGGAYAGANYWSKKYESVKIVLEDENKKIQENIDYLIEEAKKSSLFRKKLGLADYLLNNHIYWNQFFTFLEDNTLPNVYYTGGFSGGVSETYSFSVIAKDFKTMETQVAVFKSDVNVLNATYSGGDIIGSVEDNEDVWYSFDLTLTLKPDIFYDK